MIAVGVIMMIIGAAGCFYGITQNNSFEAQLNSFFSSGTTNPGTPFVVGGVLLLLIGLVLLIAGCVRKSKKEQVPMGYPPMNGPYNPYNAPVQPPVQQPYGSVPAQQPQPQAQPQAGNLFCPQCGTSLPAGSRFCSNCGHAFDAPQQ